MTKHLTTCPTGWDPPARCTCEEGGGYPGPLTGQPVPTRESDSKKTLSDALAELERLEKENSEAFRKAVAKQTEEMEATLLRQWKRAMTMRLERAGRSRIERSAAGPVIEIGYGTQYEPLTAASEQRDATADAVRRELARFDRPSLDLNPTPHDEVVPSGVRLPPTPAAMLVGEAVSITIEYRPDVGWWYRVTFSPERDWSGVALSMEDAARRAHEVVCREMKIQASSK